MHMLQHRGKHVTPRLLSLLMPLLLGAVPAVAVASVPALSPSHAEERLVFTPLAEPINLAARIGGNSVALLEVRAPDNSRAIKVVFGTVRLSPGAYIQVFTADKKTLYTYDNAEFYTEQGLSDFESNLIPGAAASVRVVYPQGKPADRDRVQIRGYRTADPQQARSIIGSSQLKQAVCYKTQNNDFWRYSEAVAKVNGASGWNIAGGPYVMTNHHVAGDIGDKQHSAVYNYASARCDSEIEEVGNSLSIKTRRVVAAGKGPGSPVPGDQDWALYQLDELAWEEAGVLPFFGALTLDTENSPAQLQDLPLYVPQHPGGRLRQIAATDDEGNACRVTDATDSKVYYNCDTYGGSSGSPVISQRTNGVVGLHYAGGGSWNVGVNSHVVYRGIAGILPAANQPATGLVGKGKVKVAAVSFMPALPAVVDSEAREPVVLRALDASRLRRQGSDYLFSAKGRATDGSISELKVRLSPVQGRPGAFSLRVKPEDNPALSGRLLTGWMAFALYDQQDGSNVRNLVLPFSYEYYDPFASPFASNSEALSLTLTEKLPAISPQVKHATNFGFLAVRSGQGPMTLQNGGTGYSQLHVQVEDEGGQVQVVNLRGQRKTACSPALRPMNSITGCGSGAKPASLQVTYSAEDNPQLPSGHYTGLLPVIASRDAFSQPLLVEIDLTVMPKEDEVS